MRRTLIPVSLAAVSHSPRGRWRGARRTRIATGRRTRGDKGSTKYSPLDQINKDTIKNLKIAWRRSGMPEELRRAVSRTRQAPANYQHTPLMVDGLLYMSTAVGAVDGARSGDRQDACGSTRCRRGPTARDRRAAASTRSLAYWTDGRDARIVANVGTNLVALNAKTGKRYADFGDNGQVDLTERLRAPDHRLALEQRPAGREGRHHHRRRAGAGHRHPQRARQGAEGDAARRHPRLRRAHRQACCGRSTSCRARASSATRRG